MHTFQMFYFEFLKKMFFIHPVFRAAVIGFIPSVSLCQSIKSRWHGTYYFIVFKILAQTVLRLNKVPSKASSTETLLFLEHDNHL